MSKHDPYVRIVATDAPDQLIYHRSTSITSVRCTEANANTLLQLVAERAEQYKSIRIGVRYW